VDISQIKLPKHRNIGISSNNVILKDNLECVNSRYLFLGRGTIDNPEIGDIRISYSAIDNPLDTATIFGLLDQSDNKISPYFGTKKNKLYRIFNETRDSAISKMKTEHTIVTWILRILGFLLMWFSLIALFNPISVFLDVFPFFGSISRAIIGFVTFIISFVLSVITILVSIIIHNLLILIIIIVGFIVGIIWYLKNK